MKAVTLIVGALAALTTAAPTVTERSFDLAQLNNLQFGNQNFEYLNLVNELNLQLFQQLGEQNNLNVQLFQGLFQAQEFQLQQLLQLQQLQTLLQVGSVGLLNGFDLGGLNLQVLNFGLLQGLNGFDVNSIVDQALVPQVQQFIQQNNGVIV